MKYLPSLFPFTVSPSSFNPCQIITFGDTELYKSMCEVHQAESGQRKFPPLPAPSVYLASTPLPFTPIHTPSPCPISKEFPIEMSHQFYLLFPLLCVLSLFPFLIYHLPSPPFLALLNSPVQAHPVECQTFHCTFRDKGGSHHPEYGWIEKTRCNISRAIPVLRHPHLNFQP